MFFALRGNYSIDSRRFLLSEGPSGNPSDFNVQGNVILYRVSLSAAVTGLHLAGGDSASPPVEVVPRVHLPIVVR